MAESDLLQDSYRFRTPMLRNIALTGPYGHNGAYPTLEGIVRHHLDPLAALGTWDRRLAQLPDVPWLNDVDFVVQADVREMKKQRQFIDIEPIHLSDAEVQELVSFLQSLTGSTADHRPLGKPSEVPSGLPID